MRSLTVDEVFAILSAVHWSAADLARLRAWLAGVTRPDECIALIEQAARGRPCPHCRCPRSHRAGKRAACGASAAWAAGAATTRSRARRWRVCARRNVGSVTCNACSNRARCARRRGINREHDCLLVARDRNGRTLDFHTGRGPVTATQLLACLRPVLAADVLLVSDAAAAYRTFAARTGISHEAVNASAGVRARGAIHIQNVNGWHSRFKIWLMRFRGVASRYLVHYSGWQRLLDARQLSSPAQCLCAAVRPD